MTAQDPLHYKRRGTPTRPILFSELLDDKCDDDVALETIISTKSDRRRNGDDMVGLNKGERGRWEIDRSSRRTTETTNAQPAIPCSVISILESTAPSL